jgi:aminoglycoside 6'-N-acetyltransferase
LPVSFRPLQRADFELLARWLALPHVTPWWPDDHSLDDLEATYGPTIDGEDPTEGFMIQLEGRPVGFIQRYLLDDYPAWCRALGIERAAGMDYLIGVMELTGVGFGPVIVEAFTRLTFDRYDDIDQMAIAVQQANHRSWRALEKAGYERVFAGMIDSDDPSDAGPSYVYVRSR